MTEFWQTVYFLVIDRLINPRSELACFQRQGKYISIEDVQLQHLYRCLDVLSEAKTAIETHIFERQKHLFNMAVDVVFYDATTFHYLVIRKSPTRPQGARATDREGSKDDIDNNNKIDTKKGYKRYIATTGENKVVGLDEERIAEDALWDGYYGIQTS